MYAKTMNYVFKVKNEMRKMNSIDINEERKKANAFKENKERWVVILDTITFKLSYINLFI